MAGSELPFALQVKVAQGLHVVGSERDAGRGESGRLSRSACSASRLTAHRVGRRLAKYLSYANVEAENALSLNCLGHRKRGLGVQVTDIDSVMRSAVIVGRFV